MRSPSVPRRDPLASSVMAWSATQRIAAVLVVVAALWLCILWAVALP